MTDSTTTGRSGQNEGGIDRDDKLALIAYWVSKLREELAPVEKMEASLALLRKNLRGTFLMAKGETGYDVELFERAIKAQGSKVRDLLQERADWDLFCAALGLPVQADLFEGKGARMPETKKDEMAWEAEGYQVGRRAGEPMPPKECPPIMGQAFMRGYSEGQRVNGEAFIKAAAIRERMANPNTQAPVNLNDPEEDERTEEEKIADAAEALKASGFTQTSGGGDDSTAGGEGADSVGVEDDAATTAAEPPFTEATPEELAAQAPRAEVQAARAAEDTSTVTPVEEPVTAEALVERRRRKAAGATARPLH